MTDSTHRLQRAQRLRERSRTEPAAIADGEIAEAVSWLRTGLGTDGRDASDDAETRKLAAESLKQLVYHDPSLLDGHVDAICTALREGQSVVATRSRVEQMGSHLRDTVECQLALLDALRQYSFADSAAIADRLGPLFPAFTAGRVHERITAAYLSLVDICASRRDGTIDVDLGQLVDLAAESGPKIQREVVDIFNTFAAESVSRVVDHVDALLDVVSRSSPAVQRKAIRLVTEVVTADPERSQTYRPFLRDRVDHPNFGIRASALCASRTLPGTSVGANHDGIDELIAALDDTDAERRRTATDILSNYPQAVPLADLPVEPLVDSLDADDRIVVLSANKLLNRIAQSTPDRLAGHLDAILDELTTLSAHQQHPAIAIIEVLAENNPELIAPHVDPIVDLVSGSTDSDELLQDRLGDFVTRLQRSSGVDPRIRHRSDTLRASFSYSTVVERKYQDLDGQSLIPYRALGVLLSLTDVAPEALVERMDGIITGLNYESHAIQRRTIVVLTRLSKTHPEGVFPFLGYITDTVQDTIGAPDATDLRVGSLYLLLRVLIRSEQDPDGLARDVEPLFELLSPALFDDSHRPIERSAVVLLLKYAYSIRLVPTESLDSEAPAMADVSEEELLETYREALEGDDTATEPEHVDTLVEFGQRSHGRTRANVVSILSKIAATDVSTTVLHLPTVFDWVAAGEPAPRSVGTHEPDAVEPVGDTPTEADLEALSVNRIDRLLDAFDADLETAVADLVSWVSRREPTALVPFVDDIVALLASTGPKPRTRLLSAFEDLVAAEPAVAPHAVTAANAVLISGSLAPRESAAHLLAMAAREEPALVAESVTGLVATVRNADSDATALFALTALSRVAEVAPDALVDFDRTLAVRLGEWNTSTVAHRDVTYVRGTSPDHLTEDGTANERTLDRRLRRTLATVVDGHASMSDFDTATLVAVATSETAVAPAAGRELVARHRETGIEEGVGALRRSVENGEVRPAVERIVEPVLEEEARHHRSDEEPA